jgi:hypothetical protein
MTRSLSAAYGDENFDEYAKLKLGGGGLGLQMLKRSWGHYEGSRWSEGAWVRALYSPKARGRKEGRDWDRDLGGGIFGKGRPVRS